MGRKQEGMGERDRVSQDQETCLWVAGPRIIIQFCESAKLHICQQTRERPCNWNPWSRARVALRNSAITSKKVAAGMLMIHSCLSNTHVTSLGYWWFIMAGYWCVVSAAVTCDMNVKVTKVAAAAGRLAYMPAFPCRTFHFSSSLLHYPAKCAPY